MVRNHVIEKHPFAASCSSKGAHAECLLLFTIIASALMLSIPSGVRGAPINYSIVARFSRSSIGFDLEGSLIYLPGEWGFNQNRQCWFNLTATVPPDATLHLNISRVALFLNFYRDYYLYTLLNFTQFSPIVTNQSQVVINAVWSFFVDFGIAARNFVVELYNPARFGFVVVFSSSVIPISGAPTNRTNYYLFSSRPSENWPTIEAATPDTNEDYVDVYLITTSEMILTVVVIVVAVIFILFFGDKVTERVINEGLPKRRTRIGGRKIHLGGRKIAQAFLAHRIAPGSTASVSSVIRQWAEKNLGIDLPEDLDETELDDNSQRLWTEVVDELWGNSATVASEIVRKAAPGNRGDLLVKQLEEKGVSISNEEKAVLTGRAYFYFHDFARRAAEPRYRGSWDAAGYYLRLIPSLARQLIQERLEIRDPHLLDELDRLLESWVDGETQMDWRLVGQTCRTVIQRFTEAVLIDEMTESGRPSEDRTREKVDLILAWIRKNLGKSGEKEAEFLKAAYANFDSYFRALEGLVQKTGHKPMKQIISEEADRCVISMYLWIGDMIRLLDKARFPWNQERNG